jgi:hypothetical protein
MHELQCFKFNAFECFICIRFISNVAIVAINYKHCYGMHNHTNMTHLSYNQKKNVHFCGSKIYQCCDSISTQ